MSAMFKICEDGSCRAVQPNDQARPLTQIQKLYGLVLKAREMVQADAAKRGVQLTDEELEKNPSRLKKTAVLADFLTKLKHSQNKQIIYLIQGKAFPDYSEKEFGISEQLCIKALEKASGISKNM